MILMLMLIICWHLKGVQVTLVLETLLMALVWIMMIAIMNSNQMQVTMIIPLRVKTKT
ncbi:hypothetical protein BAZSYMA_ACONTIG168713_0 [Bathymodiolus azoricus thioautotrophic gill symbiont]|uniref:Uncharacterized protein n=1 Tax=Bathymodiolus azoricus thioautotrophic gill symbiont TaxID=235205 RepID=A0A1H6MCN7_9GAMM|nr:hypothetical protein BAZSYMA_ACONTIG168713_0 [Bathymodiolus azoricus thioautotrophic gill symbiont]